MRRTLLGAALLASAIAAVSALVPATGAQGCLVVAIAATPVPS